MNRVNKHDERSNMRRTIVATFATLAMAVLATSASAVFIDSTCHYIKSGYRRNVAWPYPYICPDRVAVREPFEIMIRNGWRRQNLLGSSFLQPGHQSVDDGRRAAGPLDHDPGPARVSAGVHRALDRPDDHRRSHRRDAAICVASVARRPDARSV